MYFRRSQIPKGVVYGAILALLTALTTTAVMGNIRRQAPVKVASPSPTPEKPAEAPIETKLKRLQALYQNANEVSVEYLEQQMFDGTAEADPNAAWEAALKETAVPDQYRVSVHPTNFGDRVKKDLDQTPVEQDLLVVLHETVGSATSGIHVMLGNHPHDEDQVSYHALIRGDGAIIFAVDPKLRAYGAGDSVFTGKQGPETVKTKEALPPSVNNFAYHISLETPVDGLHAEPFHSGYTYSQYESLAWLITQAGVERDRVITHAEVDQSGERQDPRSFNMAQLESDLLFAARTPLNFDTN